jgi:hypothetical protein
VLNAPSPAATASLAIGEYIAVEAQKHFNLWVDLKMGLWKMSGYIKVEKFSKITLFWFYRHYSLPKCFKNSSLK